MFVPAGLAAVPVGPGAHAAHRLAREALYRRFVFASQGRVEVARERLVDDFPRNGAARRAA